LRAYPSKCFIYEQVVDHPRRIIPGKMEVLTGMNVARRIAALRREIGYREQELDRVAKLRAGGNEVILAIPAVVENYLADIRIGIAVREMQIKKLLLR